MISIPWTKIAAKIETKSKDDCRNRWYNQVYNTIHDLTEFTQKDELILAKAIKRQGVEEERDIDFEDIENGHTAAENKYQWSKLKKLVTSRCDAHVSSLAKDLVLYLTKRKGEKRYQYKPDTEETEGSKKPINRLSLLSLYREKTSL